MCRFRKLHGLQVYLLQVTPSLVNFQICPPFEIGSGFSKGSWLMPMQVNREPQVHLHKGSTVFPANGQTLEQTEDHQQDRGSPADHAKSGQAAHKGGRHCHEQERIDQACFAAVTVTTMTKEHCTHGPNNEGHLGTKQKA
jgi:hypothetical protein